MSDLPDPWDVHERHMLETYGRRDPECLWCHQPVYMALQGFYGGGMWTTDRDAEGPASSRLNDPPVRCDRAPDGWHDVQHDAERDEKAGR